jgi:hypothetical protein
MKVLITLVLCLIFNGGIMAQEPGAAASYYSNDRPTSGKPMTENESEEQIVDLIKGKAPKPPTPIAPKTEPWMYSKASYKMARQARK